MLGWRSSGLSPTPSRRRDRRSCANGVAKNTSSAAKNAPKPSSTAVA